MPTLHRTGSTPSNDNRAGHAGETIYEASAGTLSRLRQLAGGEGEGGVFGVLAEDQTIDLRAGGSGVKRGWQLASALCLGILLGVAVSCTRQPSGISDKCAGDRFQIDLADLQDLELGEDPEEHVEQLRDWIWPVLLARLEATDGLEGLLIGSATQPLLRDDALAHVLDHAVGSTRSGIAKDGTVVVMVQSEELTSMQEVLLEAIDQQALHLGATPEQALVYRYSIDERSGYADLCQIGAVDEDWIESQRHGFRRATVRKPRELASFLDGGVDLLTAQCTDEGLEVTGRVRSRVRKAPMTVEHVASLYQPPMQYVPTAELGVSMSELSGERLEWLRSVASIVDSATAGELRQVRREVDWETWNAIVQVRAWRKQHPEADTLELMRSWLAQHEAAQDLGFSLDPKLRAGDAVQHLDAFIAALEDPSNLAALLYSWDAEPEQAAGLVEITQAEKGARESLTQSLSDLRDTLRTSSDQEAFDSIRKTLHLPDTAKHELVRIAVELLEEHSAYQCARYDGSLQGTLTGMTMFYTDLVMKLWMGDHFGTAPEGLIVGFDSVVGHDLSSAHCTEEEAKYPYTRAWLGLREEQYARNGAGRVHFAPVATRVFARASELGAEYDGEGEVSAETRRFYRWWNAHYARVADWEPQYELLNQIMKWSVVTHTAALSEQQSCIDFLDQVTVDRSQRFDQWLTKQDDLRWQGPMPLVSRHDEPTECLPVLRSRWYPSCGGGRYLVGGVSVASWAALWGKPLRRPQRARHLGRLDATAPVQPRVTRNGRIIYRSVTRPDGRLTNVKIDPGQRTLLARVETAQSQRGTRHSYSADGPVTGMKKSWRLQRGKLVGHDAFDARGNRFGVSQLIADDVTGTAIRLQVKLEEAAQMRLIGTAVAWQVANDKVLSETAPDLPGVTNAWRIGGDRVLVELTGTSERPRTYMLVSSGHGVRGPPEGTLVGHFGIGVSRNGQSSVQVALLPDNAALQMRTSHGAAKLAMGSASKKMGELEQALAAGDLATAAKMVCDLPYGVHHGVRGALSRAFRQAVLRGQDTRWIVALQMQVSIQHGKPQGLVPESTVLPADGEVFLVPSSHARQYAELATLPPGVNPAVPAGTASHPFHARAIAELPVSIDAPAVVHVGDIEYTLFLRTAQEASHHSRRMYAVYPCREEEQEESRTTVDCHGRTSAREADEELRRTLVSRACRLGPQRARTLDVTECSDPDKSQIHAHIFRPTGSGGHPHVSDRR